MTINISLPTLTAEYEKSGASIAPDAQTVWQTAVLVLKIDPPTNEEMEYLPQNGRLISFIQPGINQPLLDQFDAILNDDALQKGLQNLVFVRRDV